MRWRGEILWGLVLFSVACRGQEEARTKAPANEDPEPLRSLRTVTSPIREKHDLEDLVVRMARRRLVLLGEASHGTREFYTLRSDLSLRLIREHGSRFIAVEGDWASIYRLNRYIQGEPGSPPSARAVMQDFNRWPTWMWANEEMIELVDALRAWNAPLPPERRVGLYGIDLYGPGEALEKAAKTLEARDPDLGSALRQRLEPLAPLGADPHAYVHALAQGAPSLAQATREAVEWVDDHREALRALSQETFLLVQQGVYVLHHAEQHFREMLTRDASSWNSRADHFWLTVARLLEHHGEETRGIVWAHNTHIGDARATPMASQGQRNIGQLARLALGRDQVFALGFATHRGTVKAGRNWGAGRYRMTVPAARTGSLEDWLHQLGHPVALLSFDSPDPVPEPLQAVLDHRAIGVIYHPEHEHLGNYVPTLLAQRYDALLFLDETQALTPVHP